MVAVKERNLLHYGIIMLVVVVVVCGFFIDPYGLFRILLLGCFIFLEYAVFQYKIYHYCKRQYLASGYNHVLGLVISRIHSRSADNKKYLGQHEDCDCHNQKESSIPHMCL